ncbi:MAG: hypothetical protein ABSF80_07990 [Chitinispirillaceae bacterium]
MPPDAAFRPLPHICTEGPRLLKEIFRDRHRNVFLRFFIYGGSIRKITCFFITIPPLNQREQHHE